MSALLADLKLGALTLTPTFDPDETEYTASTSDATNKLTATPEDSEAVVTVKLGDDAVNPGSDGKYTLTWESGENVVTIKVVCREVSETYTITVTAE